MSFISYDKTSGVIMLDYSLRITKETGINRLNQLTSYLSQFQGRVKLLADFRELSFDSEETHLALSKMSRTLFFEEYEPGSLFLAVLHRVYNNSVSEFEKWFTSKEKALSWLTGV